MKMNSLEKIRDVLVAPEPRQIIELDETLRLNAFKAIDRMFEMS